MQLKFYILYFLGVLFSGVFITPWSVSASGTIDIGATRINSESTTITASMNSSFTISEAEPKLEIGYIYQSQDGITTKDRLDILTAVDMPLSDRFYSQGAIRVEYDSIREFKDKQVVTVGIGTHLVKNEKTSIRYEFAPGYQFYSPQNTAIIRNSLFAGYKVSKGITVSNNTSVELGSNDEYIKNVTELSNSLTEKLSLILEHTFLQETTTDNITSIKLRIKF